MPMILPLNLEALFLRSSSEFTPLTYEGTLSSREVGPYQEPRSSSCFPNFFQYSACVVGSQESVSKSIWPVARPV